MGEGERERERGFFSIFGGVVCIVVEGSGREIISVHRR